MSAAGYELVHHGIEQGITTPRGLAEVFVGRMTDLGDGLIARRFGLATRFGAFIDAAFDKKATQEIRDAVSEEELIPELFEDAVTTQNYSNMALTAVAKIRHPRAELSPTRNGKRSMFFQGMMMGAYAMAETAREDHPTAAKAIRAAGHVMGATGLLYYGPRTTIDYAARIH
jgi:phosphatidylglycerophosphate synthase